MKMTVILIMVAALGTIPKRISKGPRSHGNKRTRRDYRNTALLRSARILRRIRET